MITTTHKDYEIRFDEREEKWECIDLRVSDKKLAGCKAKITGALREIAEVAKVSVLVVEYSVVLEGMLLVRDGVTFDGQPRYTVLIEGKRRHFGIRDIVLDTPEARDKIDKSVALVGMANTFRKQADAIIQGLPRYTPAE